MSFGKAIQSEKLYKGLAHIRRRKQILEKFDSDMKADKAKRQGDPKVVSPDVYKARKLERKKKKVKT